MTFPTRTFSTTIPTGGFSASPRTLTARLASPHVTLRTTTFEIAVGHVFSSFLSSSLLGLPS